MTTITETCRYEYTTGSYCVHAPIAGSDYCVKHAPYEDCEHYDGCIRQGYPIPEQWAESSGMPTIALCEAHRAEFHEVFIKGSDDE